MIASFQEMQLGPELLQVIDELAYAAPTPIQAAAIPSLLAGKDVMGQAQTGTGKTAAFALPILQRLDMEAGGVQALVVTPTRELANQVAQAIHVYGRQRRVRVLPVYGGQSYDRQIRRLRRGVDVVVGTPGRLLDLIRKQELDLSTVRYVVLDEADEMLSMGFIEDIEAILDETPQTRQTALFSATLPARIRQLGERYLQTPEAITTSAEQITVAAITQRYYLVHESDKLAALSRLLETEATANVLIFTRTRVRAADLAADLTARGFQAEALHGDMGQAARETTMQRFRQSKVNVLVATDVAARGLDIDDVSHVINYDIPWDAESYVHRIGRTGRAGKAGAAITLVTPRERRQLRNVEAYTHVPVVRTPLPSSEAIEAQRAEHLVDRLAEQVAVGDYVNERVFVTQLVEAGCDPLDIAAAALQLVQQAETHYPLEPIVEVSDRAPARRERRSSTRGGERRGPRAARGREQGMARLVFNLGRTSGIRPGDVVGWIANEADVPGRAVGAITIEAGQTVVDVSDKHVAQVLKKLAHSHLRGQPVHLRPLES